MTDGPVEAAARAAAAEQAVVGRHLRSVFGTPGTALGVVGWPASRSDRVYRRWHYWWQAHLLDCLIDAELRDPDPVRRRRIAALVRGIRLRNAGRWTNRYFDDMAWLGLALERARTAGILDASRAITRLASELLAAWSDTDGGIPWRRGDVFRNAPANGPAAVLLARLGHVRRAADTVDWMLDRLRDPGTGLILDGIRPGGVLQRDVYSYCQGVVLGACVELATREDVEDRKRFAAAVPPLVTAVADRLAPAGVLSGHGGGDGGLFTGILARYLVVVARRLPGDDAAPAAARRTAAALVTASAEAAWSHRVDVGGRPLFGAEWSRTAEVPRGTGPGRVADGATDGSGEPARDLSVQLGAWMLLEAAAVVAATVPTR